MPSFSKNSLNKLDTCDKRLQEICNEVIKHYDFTILCGHRNKKEQDKAYAEGKSRAKWGQSKHNTFPSMAIDIAPYPIEWNDTNRFSYLAGLMQGTALRLGYRLRWGGDWDGDGDLKDQSLNDLPHLELIEKIK